VPKGPILDFGTAHNRARLMARGAKRSMS
jgi:hypothetical protein